jgi:hypothetical protein
MLVHIVVESAMKGFMTTNPAILEAIKLGRTHENPEVEIAAIIQIAQTAAHSAYTPEKHGAEGRRKLMGQEMTVADLMTLIPPEGEQAVQH